MIGAHLKNLAKLAMRNSPTLANPLWALAYPYIIRRDGTYFGSEYSDRASAFEQIFDENRWLSCESRSGRGSTLEYTKPLRRSLAKCLKDLGVRTFLDAPCGDFNWMQHVELPEGTNYIGGDILGRLVEELQQRYGGASRSFRQMDIVEGPLPKADLWLCRDVLFHLPNQDVITVFHNFANSEIPFLLTTTYNFPKRNEDIRPGGFRFINLQIPPFHLPRPLSRITDFIAPEPPRYLGLWSKDQVRAALNVG
ncbi:MAG: class I SAM-dependent methyltransferase [Hyphomicrobiales bacterium]|nr:class I SAM-dependent methyltransferase [Hyphomicrobiales bacterium]